MQKATIVIRSNPPIARFIFREIIFPSGEQNSDEVERGGLDS
jgi:hypothetical protein